MPDEEEEEEMEKRLTNQKFDIQVIYQLVYTLAHFSHGAEQY